VRAVLLSLLVCACASGKQGGLLETPVEAARHQAALAIVTVFNQTTSPLTIAFRTAAPPYQEVVIGRVAAHQRNTLAPVPAGEPVIMVARRADGSEMTLPPRLFLLDAEWTWEIPNDATFMSPEQPK
jgi:hypothetical protein